MFAAVVNECSNWHLPVIEIVRDFVLYAKRWHQVEGLAVTTDENSWRLANAAENLSDLAAEVLHNRGVLVGSRWRGGVDLSSSRITIPRHLGANTNDGALVANSQGDSISVQLGPVHNATLNVVRRSRCNVWVGSFREDGVWIVFAHSRRSAITAASCACGCLFDDRLRLYALRRGESLTYVQGTQKTTLTEVT